MKQADIWNILGISETKDETTIKQAYRNKLVLVNPEDDAEGFMNLRKAYEQAIHLINNPEDNTTDKKKDDIDLWVDRVDSVYLSMKRRINEACWEELFQDPICIRIDTNMEARIKLLEYLMEHYYLPHNIWKLVESEFHITDDKKELYEMFPKNFIDYMIHHISHEGFIDYTLFDAVDGEDADEYINTYYKLKEEIDAKQLEVSEKILKKLEQYKTYHPYKDAEKIRYYLLSDAVNEAVSLSKDLISRYAKNFYIRCIHAKVKCCEGCFEESCDQYQKLLQEVPDSYLGKIGLLECLYKKGSLEAAKDLGMEIIGKHDNDEVVLDYLTQINDALIRQYQDMLKEKEDAKVKLELAWCFYQNQKYEESISVLNDLPEEIHTEYDFINLHGRVYLSAKQFDVALDKLMLWREAILNTEKDDSILSKKRYNRLGDANYAIGRCYSELKKYEEAVPYFLESIEAEKNIYQKLIPMERLAYTYLKLKKPEECIDQCDKIIEISCDYYPAYIHRQEANFLLDHDQEVIEDYHKAVDIFPNFIGPYLFAMKVFIRHDQFDDAEAVAERVKKCKLNSNEFKLLNIRLMRYTAEWDRDREQAVMGCLNLQKELLSEDNDIEDPISVDYELALNYASLNQSDKALEIMDSIIQKKPDDDFYYYIKGQLMKDMDKYENALKIFSRLLMNNQQSEKLSYEVGNCYQMLNMPDRALEYYLRTVEINPRYSDVNEKIFDIYHEMYKDTYERRYYVKALPYVNMQIEINPNGYNYICRGLLYMDAYELDKAAADFNQALEDRPEDPVAYNNAGYNYLLMREMDMSIEKLQEAAKRIAINEYKLPYANLGDAYRIIKKYDEALQLYENLNGVYPKIKEYMKDIAELYKCKQDTKQSIEWIKKLKRAGGYNRSDYKSMLADVYFLSGNKYIARIYYILSVIIDPKNIAALLKYSEFLLSNGYLIGSTVTVKKALRYAKANESSYIEICRRAALVYWSMKLSYMKKLSICTNPGRCDKKAKKLGTQALQTIGIFYKSESEYYDYAGSRAERLVALASIYLCMGEEDKAEDYIHLALESRLCRHCNYMRCVHAFELYGMLYEAGNQWEKAMEYYNTIIDLDPGNMTYKKRLNNVKEKSKL